MRAIWWLAILGGGCKQPPVEAPAELGALALFLFEHFEDEDPAEVHAGWVNLAAFLRDDDLTRSAQDRAVTLPTLDGPALGGLSIPVGALAVDQVPVGISGDSAFPLDDQLPLMADPVQTCIESSTTVWAGRDFLTDADCFVAGACERMETVTAVRRDTALAKVWYDQFKTYRRFDFEDPDGAPVRVIAGRAWTEVVFPGDNDTNSWDQLFHLDVYLADGDRTLRWFAIWSSVSIGVLGDDLYAALIINGLEEALVYGDELIEGTQDSCPHDRSAPAPPRD